MTNMRLISTIYPSSVLFILVADSSDSLCWLGLLHNQQILRLLVIHLFSTCGFSAILSVVFGFYPQLLYAFPRECHAVFRFL